MESDIFKYLKYSFRAFSIVFISVLVFLFSPYFSNLDFTKSGPFGDTLSGFAAVFIGGLSVIFTFLAFWSQFQANQLQALQFQKQNEDSIFFRLLDTQNLRIINSSIFVNGVQHSSFQLLEQIVKAALQNIKSQTTMLARQLICENPESISLLHYRRMFELNAFLSDDPKKHVHEIFDSLMKSFLIRMEGMDSNERWEFIKVYFNSVNAESKEQSEVLMAIGSVQFYKIPFEKRQDIYNVMMQNNDNTFGSFLDGYLKGWEFIATYSSNSLNRNTYKEYVSSQLSKFETIILFYYLASGHATKSFCQFAQKANIFNSLVKYNGLLIDAPSKKEIEKEVENIFSFYE